MLYIRAVFSKVLSTGHNVVVAVNNFLGCEAPMMRRKGLKSFASESSLHVFRRTPPSTITLYPIQLQATIYLFLTSNAYQQ